MKIVFYKELLDMRKYPDLNYNERIVYSFLVSKSVICDGQYLDKESGELNRDWINADIEQSGFIPMVNFSYRKIAEILHLTLQAIFNIIHSLKDKNYINTTAVKLNKGLIGSGYFELIFKPGLRGKMLITYSYFKEKSSYFNGTLDTHKIKLAQELGVDIEVLKKTLTNLYRLGLIKRLKDNRLQIL